MQEGFVVVDAKWRRLKIKSRGYVALHHLGGNHDRSGGYEANLKHRRRRIAEIVRNNEGTYGSVILFLFNSRGPTLLRCPRTPHAAPCIYTGNEGPAPVSSLEVALYAMKFMPTCAISTTHIIMEATSSWRTTQSLKSSTESSKSSTFDSQYR